MQLFYQGQLDFFCAVYAVINALTAMYGLNLAQARSFLASILNEASLHRPLWQAMLENRTDFYWLVDYMLAGCHRGGPHALFVRRPFAPEGEESVPDSALDLAGASLYRPEPDGACFRCKAGRDAVWSALETWLPPFSLPPAAGTVRRTVLLRFHRYMPYMKSPVISHWSVADRFCAGTLHLRDASKEESALHALVPSQTVFDAGMVSGDAPVRLEPGSLYFLERV